MSDTIRHIQIQSQAASVLLEHVRDVVGDDEEMILTAVEGETGLLEAISEAVERVAQLEAHCEALAIQSKKLSERRDRFEAQKDRIKAAVHVAMSMAELRKLELPAATLSVRAVPAKAEIIDEAAIPSKFWKAVDPKLDRKAVLDALKAKEDVPGATMSNGGETISIRWA